MNTKEKLYQAYKKAGNLPPTVPIKCNKSTSIDGQFYVVHSHGQLRIEVGGGFLIVKGQDLEVEFQNFVLVGF